MAEPDLTAQRRQVLTLRVQARASQPDLFNDYARLCERLPQWLGQHGLRLTLDYLRMLASGRSNQAAAWALLADWAASGVRGALSWPGLVAKAGQHWLQPCADDLLQMQALALVDAEALRHACTLVAFGLPMEDGPLDQLANPLQLPVLQPHPALQHGPCVHPGIAWRFCGAVPTGGGGTWRGEQVRRVTELTQAQNFRDSKHSRWYAASYRRHLQWLQSLPKAQDTRCWTQRLRSHLFTGLGERGVWETHALLHSVSGMPFVAASQIKNLVRRAMQARLQRLPDETSREAIQALLDDLLGVAAGDGPGGLLVVHDAWWVPDEIGDGAGPLAGDVDNNHHTEYLRRDAKHPRALPQDSPQPQPQLAVQGAMLFALGIHPAAGPGGPAIVERCQRWLQMALTERGIGGRTYAAGAGRFQAPLASGADEGGGH